MFLLLIRVCVCPEIAGIGLWIPRNSGRQHCKQYKRLADRQAKSEEAPVVSRWAQLRFTYFVLDI